MADFVPYFYTPSFSSSTWENFEGCGKRYFLGGPGAHGGWSRDPNLPKEIREHYVLKKIVGGYGWAGGLIHDFLEEVSLGYAKGELSLDPSTLSDRASKLAARFDKEWRESDGYNGFYFEAALSKRASGQPSPIRLSEHANRDIVRNQTVTKETLWRWTSSSLNTLIEEIPNLFNGVNPEDVLLVESNTPHQASSHVGGDRPFIPLFVDGAIIKVYVGMDLALRRGNKIDIIDLKTGKEKPEHWSQLQLYGWSADTFFPGVKPEEITLSLLYPKSEPGRRIQSVDFSAASLEEIRSRTEKALEDLIARYPRIIDESVDHEVLSTFYRPHDVQMIEALRDYTTTRTWRSDLSKFEVARFVIQNFSPQELSKCLERSKPEIVTITDEELLKATKESTPEWVNRAILRRVYLADRDISSDTQLSQFVDDISLDWVRVPLPSLFSANGAEFEPYFCRSCSFLRACDEGRETLNR